MGWWQVLFKCAKTCLKKYQNCLKKVIIVSVSEKTHWVCWIDEGQLFPAQAASQPQSVEYGLRSCCLPWCMLSFWLWKVQVNQFGISAGRRSWFWLAHKRSTRWSSCSNSRRMFLSSSQKANGDSLKKKKNKWWLSAEIKEKHLKTRISRRVTKGTISLVPSLVVYLSNMSNLYAAIQHILELVGRYDPW